MVPAQIIWGTCQTCILRFSPHQGLSKITLSKSQRHHSGKFFWGPGYDHFLWLVLYFNATVKLLEPFSNVTPRARCCHSTDITLLCKPRLASNFWPWWAQHVRTRRTTIVPQPAEHWRRQASLEAVCAPTELPDENSSNQSLQAGYKLPQLLNPKVHPQTHVLQDSDKTKRGCPQGNWNNGTVENFRGRCPQHQLAEDKKFEEGGVNSWGVSSDTLYFERELRSCLLGR